MEMHVLCFGKKLNKEVCCRFISICKSFKFTVSLGMVIMKHSSWRFGTYFPGFGCQSEKFSCTGTCIRCNFTSCYRTESTFCFLLSNWQIVCLFIHIGAQYLCTRLIWYMYHQNVKTPPKFGHTNMQ